MRSAAVRRALTVVLCALAVVGVVSAPAAAANREVTPLARAHAHNDYEHDRPLFDALSHGFTSVEADIWLVDGELLIGHDLEDVRPGRTLESLYLRPLRRVIHKNGGDVYRDYDHYFTLLVDIKSQAVPTYRVLHRELRRYRDILTVFGPRGVNDGAVTAIVSGNRPRSLMERQRIRYAAYDGRLADLGGGAPQSFMPLISDNWTIHFTWDGHGEMPEDERRKLQAIVAAAHAEGKRVRFWATPDAPGEARANVWAELLAARVDFINTDHLGDLADFLLNNDHDPSEPYVTWEHEARAGGLRRAS